MESQERKRLLHILTRRILKHDASDTAMQQQPPE